MPEAAGAASGFAERAAFLQLDLKGGLEHELRDAVPSSESSGFAGRIEQDDGDLAAIVGVDDAHALRHGEALHGAVPPHKEKESMGLRERRLGRGASSGEEAPLPSPKTTSLPPKTFLNGTDDGCGGAADGGLAEVSRLYFPGISQVFPGGTLQFFT